MSAAQEEVFVPAATVVEIDANDIAAIIIKVCRVKEALAVKAANLIIDHLIAVHRKATRKQ
jgi:phosphoglycerate dehydrogenase-like enzyme